MSARRQRLGRSSPRILLIEDNSGLGDATAAHHMHAHGYARFDRTGVNDWYGRIGDSERVNFSSRLRTLAMFSAMPLSRRLRLFR
jgi:transketolase C-terminal domain/subunit